MIELVVGKPLMQRVAVMKAVHLLAALATMAAVARTRGTRPRSSSDEYQVVKGLYVGILLVAFAPAPAASAELEVK